MRFNQDKNDLRSACSALAVACCAIGIRAEPPGGAKDAHRVLAAVRAADESRMSGAYAEAIEAYERASDSLEAICGLARCYLETGRYVEAEETLNRADTAGGDSGTWQRVMADVLTVSGRYSDAIAHARRALAIDGRDHRARYLLGRLYEYVGARDDALQAYAPFDQIQTTGLPSDAAGLSAVAGGFLRFSVMSRHSQISDRTQYVIRDLYQRAYQKIDRTYWPARLAAADLLRSKSRHEDATEDYRAALKINENLADAHTGLGWIALDRWDFEAVEKHIERALECNPRFVPAARLDAALKLTERRYADAKAAAERALAVNLNDVESLAYAAAASFSMNDAPAVAAYRKRAYAINPTPAAYHRIMGDALGALRQYADSERHYLVAIEADPTDPRPRTELGLMYMQWGEERKAADALAGAWELDEFDTRTLNTMQLLSDLNAYQRRETEHFTIKHDAATDAVLVPYMAEYLEEIHDELAEDYEWTLADKTVVELFPTHRMFGVRITGKPWIHTVGACTGRVIAMESPRDHPQLQGAYNVARVLRHEYTHTVTLAATENRIPHWFTEGLAVMQEDAPRPWAWCTILAEAVRRGELFTLESIDWGFMRPKKPNDRQMAYAQSAWMCEFIVERFGYSAINRMIAAYRNRKAQPDVLKEILQLDPTSFDQAFAAWASAEAGAWGLELTPPEDPLAVAELLVDEPENADLHARLARARYDGDDPEGAMIAARRALGFDPKNVDALALLGEILWSARETIDDEGTRRMIDAELLPTMGMLRDVDQQTWIAPRVLGAVALERGDLDSAVAHFKRLEELLPLDPVSDRSLAGVYLARDDHDRALPHLLELARTEEDDADIPLALTAIYEKRNSPADAAYWCKRSIYADAFRVETHVRLASLSERLGDKESAIREYKSLCLLEPNNVKHLERAAFALAGANLPTEARDFAARAVALDADSSARSLLDDNDQ